ncbi:hypothetical protein [Micromonospora pattaloongensis]|nr:hypothetical protein [Micromonospora pattaloongensis]
MEFSVVELGYDREQVDHCLEDLGEQLDRMTTETRAAVAAAAELTLLREEVTRLRRMLRGRPAVYRTSARLHHMLELAQEEATEIVAQANAELAAARREAAQVREQAYNDALQARRDFEAALHARRRREQEVDVILRQIRFTDRADAPGEPTPGATPGRQPAAPAARTGTGGGDAQPPASNGGSAPADGGSPRPAGARWPRIRSRMISAGR